MKKIVAIIFVISIIFGGLLTVTIYPRQVFGGLVRGYVNASNENSIFKKIGSSFKTFDERTSEYFAFHDLAVHTYGGVQNILDRSLINDVDKSSEVLKLSNGYLTFKRSGYTDLSGLGQYLDKLKEVCDSVDSKLLYVNKLSKSTNDTKLLPENYPYTFDSNFSEIKYKMERKDISILDLEDQIIEENIDKYSLFFKTDHHWTPQAGLWVANQIFQTINKDYDWNLNSAQLNVNNFNIKNYPNSFLGSEGKRVGALYTKVDDFDIVTPIFDTNLTVEMKDINLNKTGTFTETLIFEESITPDNLLNKMDTAYCAYMKGNHDLVCISNHLNKNGKKALLILDSYGCVVAPYLSLDFYQLDCIDIRYYEDSVEEYIKSASPDIVIYAIENYQK